jgi:hypothetical protein
MCAGSTLLRPIYSKVSINTPQHWQNTVTTQLQVANIQKAYIRNGMADLQKYMALEYTSHVLVYLCATTIPLYRQWVVPSKQHVRNTIK